MHLHHQRAAVTLSKTQLTRVRSSAPSQPQREVYHFLRKCVMCGKTAGVKNVRIRKERTETRTLCSVSLNWFAFWFYRKIRCSLQPKGVSIRKQPLSNTVTFQYPYFNSIHSRVSTEKAKVLTQGQMLPVVGCEVTLEARGLMGKAQQGTSGI